MFHYCSYCNMSEWAFNMGTFRTTPQDTWSRTMMLKSFGIRNPWESFQNNIYMHICIIYLFFLKMSGFYGLKLRTPAAVYFLYGGRWAVWPGRRSKQRNTCISSGSPVRPSHGPKGFTLPGSWGFLWLFGGFWLVSGCKQMPDKWCWACRLLCST